MCILFIEKYSITSVLFLVLTKQNFRSMENFIVGAMMILELVSCIFYCNPQMNILIQTANPTSAIARRATKLEVKNVMLSAVTHLVGMRYLWDGVSLR